MRVARARGKPFADYRNWLRWNFAMTALAARNPECEEEARAIYNEVNAAAPRGPTGDAQNDSLWESSMATRSRERPSN